ncbi:uncharacterized protein [Montipora foliosa]|uniref:uncharacterized protein isoform X1 n=1 Tax=Montipora foliosa TaxID=591990 RepID=UPI0035F1C147
MEFTVVRIFFVLTAFLFPIEAQHGQIGGGGGGSSKTRPGICPEFESAECPEDLVDFCTEGEDSECPYGYKCCFTGCEFDCLEALPGPTPTPTPTKVLTMTTGPWKREALPGPTTTPTPTKSVFLLTYVEKPCNFMRTGMVRSTAGSGHTVLEVCSRKQWRPYLPQCNPLKGCYNNRVPALIGHWRMDEQTGNEVADDSGLENHGSASGAVPKLSKFSRGRFFNAAGLITVPNTAILNFGSSSFSVTGWAKIMDVKYPLTTFAIRKGFGCYFGPHRHGWVPGWETGHGYQAKGLHVCIRDKQNKPVNKVITFDQGYQPAQLVGQWVHYAVVFHRENKKKVLVYVNGKKQSNTLDISAVRGSVDNTKPLEFGQLYGWKTNGTLDEYRVYNTALDDNEVTAILKNHLV